MLAEENIRALLALCMLVLSSARLHAQQGCCLADANGDGHPLFGNPEVMLNPFDDLLGFTSTLPTWGALGDLDGDGDLDAVATYAREHPIDAEQSSLVVLLNAGDGVFHSDARYECGDYPSSVAIGDLNGDGLNDLAVTNTYSGQVSVLINAGGGHFPTHVGYFSGGLPRSVVIADLNGDGLPDLAVLNVGTDNIAIFLNTGSGTFTHLTNYPALNIPEELIDFDYYSFGGPHLSAGDVDGDGDIDLVTPGASWQSGLYGLGVMFNNGQAGFSTLVFHATGGFPWSSALGDLDGDGDLDVSAPTIASDHSRLAVLLNPGNGSLAPHMDYSVEYAAPAGGYDPRSISLGDLDQDGDLDVAVGLLPFEGTYQNVTVLLGAGDGSFGPPIKYGVAPDPRVVALGDVNGDGHLDLAAFTFQFPEDKLAVLMNDGTGALITDSAYPDYLGSGITSEWPVPYRIGFSDIDSDADLDVVVLNHGFAVGAPANLAVIRNEGSGTFDVPVHYPIPGHFPTSMALGDMDGDMDMDVVVTGPQEFSLISPGRVSLLLNLGDGTFVAPTSYPTGGLETQSAVLADLDGDGDLDVLTTNYYSNSISVLLNSGDGTLMPAMVQQLSGLSPDFADVADLNGDLVPDLVARAQYPERVFVMFGSGDGSFALGPTYYPSAKVGGVVVADFDADADNDLAVSARNEETDPVTFTLLKNDGTGSFADAAQYWSPGTSSAGAMVAADIDADGDIDLGVATLRSLSAFWNDGSGGFGQPVGYSAGLLVVSLTAGDLDQDGHPEFGTANILDHTFSILWNRGCHATPPNLSGDLDGDGDVDLLDWKTFSGCITGPGEGAVPDTCTGAPNLDGDGGTDLRDCALFTAGFTGS